MIDSAHFGRLEQQNHREREHGDEGEQSRDGALAQSERGFAQVPCESDEFCRVLVDPLLHVIAAENLAEPTLAVFRLLTYEGRVWARCVRPLTKGSPNAKAKAKKDRPPSRGRRS